jgi:hypothetical protein
VLFVQWTPLMKIYKKAIYSGRMPLTQPNNSNNNLSTHASKPDLSYCLVTVGTTQFNELIQAIDNAKFCDLLKQKGFTGLHVQYGMI